MHGNDWQDIVGHVVRYVHRKLSMSQCRVLKWLASHSGHSQQLQQWFEGLTQRSAIVYTSCGWVRVRFKVDADECRQHHRASSALARTQHDALWIQPRRVVQLHVLNPASSIGQDGLQWANQPLGGHRSHTVIQLQSYHSEVEWDNDADHEALT